MTEWWLVGVGAFIGLYALVRIADALDNIARGIQSLARTIDRKDYSVSIDQPAFSSSVLHPVYSTHARVVDGPVYSSSSVGATK